MAIETYILTALILTACGTAFAGYMSLHHVLLDRCPFGEPCPLFLGKPACWYGFFMFGLMFVSALLAFLKKAEPLYAKQVITIISAAGIIFASRFALPELKLLFSGQHRYQLLLPTCTWGLLFYLAVFAVSVIK